VAAYSRDHLVSLGERVDALATELLGKTRLGIANPFILHDLRDYLPFWAHASSDQGWSVC